MDGRNCVEHLLFHVRSVFDGTGQAVIDKVNQEINVPLMSESRERRAIEKLVDKVCTTNVKAIILQGRKQNHQCHTNVSRLVEGLLIKKQQLPHPYHSSL